MITALSIDFYKALPYNKYIENSIRKERHMIVKTAVRQYKTTDKEIFLQSKTDLAYVDKDDDVEEKFGYTVSHAKVKRIDTTEAPDSITIYI